MAISITQRSKGSDWVSIQVSGLNPNYPKKEIVFYIDRNEYFPHYTSNSGGSTARFTIENLSPNTSYRLDASAFAYYTIGGVEDWWADPQEGANTAYTSISTTGGGGGGGDDPGSPYYTYQVGDTSVTITIHNINSGYYYSFWIRNANDTGDIYDSQNVGRTQTNPFTITGLNSNTTYLIKQVDYTEYSSGTPSSLTPIEYLSYGSGNQSTQFTTTGSSPPTPSTGGKVHIYVNGVWRTATPYIYTNSGWRSATPYIYTNSGWRSCTT